MKAALSKVELCKIGDIGAGTSIKVETAGLTLAVFNIDGQFYVTDDACTHGPGSLSQGDIHGDVVACNFHQGRFNIRTGQVVAAPCFKPVNTYKTQVEDDTVYVLVYESRGWQNS